MVKVVFFPSLQREGERHQLELWMFGGRLCQFAATCELAIGVSISDGVAVDAFDVFNTLVVVLWLWVKVTDGLVRVHVMVMTST